MKQIVTATLVLILFRVSAQDVQTVNSNAGSISSDPSALSAMRSASIQVNKSTGTAQITYPVANLQGKSIEIPVFLSYDASGRKVQEDDGAVGWGWSLVAGGVITRITNGYHDEYECALGTIPEYSESYLNNFWSSWDEDCNPWVDEDLPDSFDGSNLDHQSLAQFASLSYQPDEFYFSLPNGRSGMFVINKEGEAVLIPYQAYRVEIHPRNQGFTITDEVGMKYIFVSRSISYTSTPDAPNILGHNGTLPIGTFTTWYLDEIRNEQSETEILFTYENAPNKELSDYIDSYLFYNGTDCPDDIIQNNTHYVYHTESKRILSIESNLGASVEFNYFIDESLEGIIVNDFSGTELYSAWLDHNAFQTEGGIPFWRLKLEGVRMRNSSGEFEQFTQFEYDDNHGNLFPNVYSSGYDHWGFYNGLSLAGLSNNHVLGGLRKVDPDFNQMGILKTITYPNGSQTSFEYETNLYSSSPSGLVHNQDLGTEQNFSCQSVVSSTNFIEHITPPSTQFSNSCCMTYIPVGQQQNLCCLVDIPSYNCGLGYTFYDPENHYPEYHEGDDNVFDIDDMDDPDRPTNTSENTDLQSNELCYIPEIKSSLQTNTFFIEFTQDVELTGVISKSYCASDHHVIKIIAMDDNSIVWIKQSNNSVETEIAESISLEYGLYRVECKVFYPFFNDVYNGYIPLNFDIGSQVTATVNVHVQNKPQYQNANVNYGGGLRISAMTIDDGDAEHLNDQVTIFTYDDLNTSGRSSGYLLSDPIYEYYIDFYFARYKMSGPDCTGNDNNYCLECGMSYWSESGLNQLINANGGYILYASVQTLQSDINGVVANGRIEEEFSVYQSENANPIIGGRIPYKSWRSGLPIASKVKNQNGQVLSESTQIYAQVLSSPERVKSLYAGKNHFKHVGGLLQSCSNYNNPCSQEFTYVGQIRSYESELYAPIQVTNRYYDQVNPNKWKESTTSYIYESAVAGLPSRIISQTSDPILPFTVQEIKYVGDYILSAGGDDMTDALNHMINIGEYGLNTAVETITLQGAALSDLKVVGGVINTFRLEGAKVVPDATYKMELDEGIEEALFEFSKVQSNQFVFDDQHYRKIAHIEDYDNNQRPIASQKENDILTTIIRDYPDGRPVAEIVNAEPIECAYTSFETDTDNGWEYSQSYVTSPNSPVWGLSFHHGKTGSKAFALSNFSGNIERNVAPGSYILSFWTTSTSAVGVLWYQTVTPIVLGDPDGQGWKYYEYLISSEVSTTLELAAASNCLIDELRIYPADASMKTTSYNADGTVRSECGVNNRVTTYLYDSWKRLEWTLDDNWQILTHHQYHIKNQNDPNDHNWQKEQVVMVQNMSKDDVINASPGDESVISTITYSDGLGRPVQSLSIRQAPNQNHDLVSINVYDALGRESRKYLPFVSSIGNNGDFISNAIDEVLNFYDNTPRVAETAFPFSETDYEKSPLSRPLRQGHVGAEWQLSTTHTIKTAALLNDANEVLLWTGNEYYANAMIDGLPRYYPANTLVKKEIEDEHGVKVWEYSNSLGQVVCKRVKVWTRGGDLNPYTYTFDKGHLNEFEELKPDAGLRNFDSYFVYDELGRLLYELPAKFIFDCAGVYQFQVYQGGTNADQFNGFATAYRYDHRSRQIEKKKPGEAWSEYVYNSLNQVVLSKSPELSSTDDKWNYVKYDALGRPIQTGFYTSTLDRENLQNLLDGISTHLWETKGSGPLEPYTGVSFPVMSPQVQVLTETYYDDYLFDINGYTYNYNSQPLVDQGLRLRGAVTGTKTLVLDGNNNYLTSVSYYDQNGRLSTQYSENILGGYDNILTEYDYTGKVTRSLRYFVKEVGGDILTIENKFEYDHSGRPTNTRQKIGNGEEVVLSRLVYNAIGQVVKKHLHIAGSANMGMQVVDYRYNERGWLTKINNADLANDGDNLEYWDVFGEELIYHEESRYFSTIMDMKRQFNGNIGAIKWKTNRDPEGTNGLMLGGHSYVYRYDKLGQMTGAFYAASSDGDYDNYSFRENTWDEKVNYDSNGNIERLSRSRGMNSGGGVLNTPLLVDNLNYDYYAHSNQIKSIQDGALDTWVLASDVTNPFTHFIDNNVGGDEYTYDTEGRMLTDVNKGLRFEYNHLDLVQSAFEGTEEVKFTWDATGRKLAKVVGGVTTYYFNGIEYTGPQFSHLATVEGAARNVDGLMNDGLWVYDYYLKDHLGNVRAVVTNENSLLMEEKVTMELAKRLLEDANFDNVSSTDQDKPYMYPYDPDDATNQKVSELSAYTGKIIGPAKVMSISAGEKIDLSTKYWYTEAPGDPLTNVTEILAGTLLNLGLASAGVIPSTAESGMALINNVSGSQFGALNSFINNSFNNVDLSKPQAFIVYMTFDKEMNLDPLNSGIVQVSTANALGQLSRTAIAPKKDGYFYTYVTNRSAGKVHFDNMVIKRWAPQVRVTYDYYPYGLTWEDPRLPGSPESIHDHCYQDKEFQWAEFTTGHGLALHDFHARMYDGATGRWLVPDPAAQFANPYLAMGNNPVVGVDPDGRYSFSTLTSLAQGIKSGVSNLWAHHLNGEAISLKQGIGYFTQGFISGMANSYLGNIVPRLNSLKAPGKQELRAGINSFTTVLSAIGAGIDVATTGNWNRFGETGKILLGRSYVDENRTWAGGIWQGLSRSTWEKNQTFIGFNYMMLSSAFRHVDVGYYHGATVGRNVLGSSGAVSLGNYISTGNLENDEEAGWGFGDGSYTTMHEYGHYLQSQIYGPLYFPIIGNQSAISSAYWTEHDANFRAAVYFYNQYGFEWRSDYYDERHPLHRYSYLPAHKVNPEWYEYAALLFFGSINFILP